MSALKKALDDLLTKRDPYIALENDPLSFVHRYKTKADQEVAAVFAAQLAYGRVSLFFPIIDALLTESDIHGGPHAWVISFTQKNHERIKHIYYRLNKSPDFTLLVLGLQGILAEFGSLHKCFSNGYHEEHPTINRALDSFVEQIATKAKQAASQSEYLSPTLPSGFFHMLARPSSGSACKRWNLFLRWMIREEFPDLGIWKFPKNKLIIPLDTHVHQIARMLGLCSKTTANNKTAEEITDSLRVLDATDPIRYDFAIAHLGISGACQKQFVSHICTTCALQLVCTIGKKNEHHPKRMDSSR